MDQVENKFVMSVDVGTSSTRCQIYDCKANVVGQSSQANEILYPKPGYIELNPEHLWDNFLHVCRVAIQDSNITSDMVSSLGISVLRNSFVIWNPKTGEFYHNIITWNDTRADKLCHDLNKSLKLKSVQAVTKLGFWVTRSKRFLAGSLFKYSNQMVIPKLLWVLQEMPNIKEAIPRGEVLYGTVDTWLVWKLTQGSVHATDYTNASVSGFYDPFTLNYSAITDLLFGLPKSIFPVIKNTTDDFGVSHASYFGHEIPIRCIIGDQQAAMFGECCFNLGDIKCTLGTGSFLNMNTGEQPFASFTGFYPCIGWKCVDQRHVYLMEGSVPDSGLIMKWANSIDMFSNPGETASIAESVSESDGVYFIPNFNPDASFGSLLGLSPNTSKAHIVRAILESLAFQIYLKIEGLKEETSIDIQDICMNGGISNNDFILQMIADLSNKPIYRSENVEMSSLGAAFLAGIAVGVWKDFEELKKLKKVGKIFKPREEDFGYRKRLKEWLKIVEKYNQYQYQP